VGQIERRALRRMRADERRGSCAAVAFTSTATSEGASAASSPPAGTLPLVRPLDAGEDGGRSVSGAGEAKSRGDVKGESKSGRLPLVSGGPSVSDGLGSTLALVLAFNALAACIALAGWRARGRFG
jgi:hypothetical protein